MAPEKLELLRKWIQNECRYMHYKLSAENSIDGISVFDADAEQNADAAFFKVVTAFCGTD